MTAFKDKGKASKVRAVEGLLSQEPTPSSFWFEEGIRMGYLKKDYIERQKVRRFVTWIEKHFGCSCKEEYEKEKKKLGL